MKISSKDFRVAEGDQVDLKKWPTLVDPVYKSKDDYQAMLHGHVEQLSEQQQLLYASDRYALLLIFQAMDAAGKDGAIKHVMSGVNPQGCQVFSFKHPSDTELQHDFLWRTHKVLPGTGRIGVHNRSHYENVLITKVHPELLLNEKLPGMKNLKDIDKKFWKHRYESIRSFEKHLHDNGMVIIKFFLNVSKDEQKERFLQRIDNPEKNWKFSADDMKERECWDDYMAAYEKAIQETATEQSPWYIIPADKKWFTRIAISTIILDTLKGLKLKYPVLPKEQQEKLEEAKKLLLEK